jgi:signal transduction histidine kinase/ActR/RegA family two-component response regulator
MALSASPPARLLSLRWHLAGLGVVSLLPLAVFAAALVIHEASEERDRTGRALVERAQVFAGSLDREIAASLRALETLARSERLARADLAGFRREALRVQEVQPSWIAILLFTPDGRRIVDTREPDPGGTTVDPESFAEALRSGRPTVGDLVRARDGVTWAFALRAPVVEEGRVRYLLTAAVSAEEIGRALAVGGADAAEWTRTVVDRRGAIVARTRAPERWVGRRAPASFLAWTQGAEGLFRERALEGLDTAVGFARAPLTGWTAAVAASGTLVDEPMERAAGLLAFAGVATIALSAGAAFLVARRFGRAVASAADAAQALSSGGPVTVEPSGILEVARLGEALASSGRLLEARREEGERHLARAAEAHREAEASSRAKDEFLAMLGHELRNPLSPIVTALHLLRQRGSGWGREHEIIARQVGHLVRLVDDLLDVSRVTRAKISLHPERLELCGVVARAVELTSPLLEERRHRLDLDVPAGLVVLADPARLAQVVGNLLANAARYTPSGGHVGVVARREAGGIVLEVSDDGQGIDRDLLPRVFDPFVQGPRGSDRAQGGLGIGLALVKSLVALHGGTVEARSEGPGRGATFRVTLPAAAPLELAAPIVPLRPPTAHAARRLRVLVVDDNTDAATLLADFLRRAGHEAEVASDGPTAVAAALARRPDVAVLDLGLPVMDGYEVATLLRRRLGAQAPAIIGVTGYGQERDRERSRAAGFLHHLVKPADPAELLAVLEAAGGGADRRAPEQARRGGEAI